VQRWGPVGAVLWHAINEPIADCSQRYQLMNANAHAGEFPSYAVALQYSTAKNLREFLVAAKDFVESLS